MVVVLFVAVALLLAGVTLLLIARRRWRRAGLPAGALRYSDTGATGEPAAPLFSTRYQLAGRPDYLVERGRVMIPVEVKSGAAPPRPFDSHVLQLAAYCLLVEETYGRPPYGILRYADRSFQVPYSDALRAELLGMMDVMRALLQREREPARPADEHRCIHCGYRASCL
jgi:CRISPR-associated exonuclease Cas4